MLRTKAYGMTVESIHTLKSSFLLNALANHYHVTPFADFQREQALRWLENEWRDRLNLNDLEVRKRRFDSCKVRHTSTHDFLEKLIALSPTRHCLAGIRHVGCNPEKPFVDVWTNFTIRSEEELAQLSQLLCTEFAPFAPLHLTFWTSPTQPLARMLDRIAKPSRRIFAAPRQMRRVASPLSLSPTSDSYYDWYQKTYHQFHAAHPYLTDWVPASDGEELEACRHEGHLFDATIDRRRVGLIAAQESHLLGMKGIYFVELLLVESMRGKGLAPLLQQQFINTLSHDIEVVWGTIDARNIPSTKTAQRSGRRPISVEYFIPL